jgi:uncharacterized protein YycO
MKILAYHGVSVVSALIRFQTRSTVSHMGIQLSDGTVVEAWAEGFFDGSVRQIGDPFDRHTPGTRISVYRVGAPYDEALVEAYLVKQLGQKYDYLSIWRFLSRRSAPVNTKKFCSELVEMAFKAGGLRLLHGNPSEHSPRDTIMSPYLVYERTIGG